MNKFRWAYIGAGNIAYSTARSILKGDHEITAVYNRTYKKAVSFAEKFGAKAYESFDKLLLSDFYFSEKDKNEILLIEEWESKEIS